MTHGEPEQDHEGGFVLVLLLSIFAGMLLAGLASFALISAGSTGDLTPIKAPDITYDSA